MSSPKRYPCGGVSRRGFLAGAGMGLAVGAPAGWFGFQHYRHVEPQLAHVFNDPKPQFTKKDGMPGPYPGRVVEVRDENSVDGLHRIHRPTVKKMLDRGMCELTRSNDVAESWRSFFSKDDVVGIKVNPVGRVRTPGGIGSISNFETILEIVAALKEHVGLPGKNILLFERYADEFRDTGYDKLLFERGMEDVRWFASASAYDQQQVLISGQYRRERDPNVVGYDPDAFVTMGFAHDEHSERDDRRHRSHLSMIVSRMVNKIITIPVLKDHRSAGVTLALKNMSHGFNNNVARSHLSGIYRRDGATSGPNQCNTFIPTAVNQPAIKQKTVLHIMDGLVAVYEGGPGAWNRVWGTWRHKALFFATDPVAMDHVGWQIIDARRKLLGWSPVAQMGLHKGSPHYALPPHLVATMLASPPESAMAMFADHERRARFATGNEPFDRRQPEHVILAGMIGLGVWNAGQIEHKKFDVT